MVTCTCKKFLDNIDLLNLGFMYMQSQTGKGYTGAKLEYCPWCGKKLQKVQKRIYKKKFSFLRWLFHKR